ncbi:MAG: hypothetical protein ABI461_12395, partial [Polyangiaceae bacterium]
MRRFVLAVSVIITAGAAACGNPVASNPPDLITVKGYVVQDTVPLVGAAVYLTDHFHIGVGVGDASPFPAVPATYTDGAGRFYVFGVGSSYDLAVTAPGNPNDITIVQNLTRRDPTISLTTPKDVGVRSCRVATTFTTALPAGTTIAYFLQGPTYPGVQLLGLAPADANPSDGLTATWRGSVSTTANLWALAYMRDASTGLPTSYLGFA